MADEEKGNGESMEDQYTKDGTVDLKGRPFRRAKGGGWAASSFILVFDALERVAYFAVASNLIIYLADVLHQGTITSARNVSYWMGTTTMISIFAAFIADSFLGRYRTCLISSAIFLLGMILLTLSVSLSILRPPSCNSSSHEDCKNLTTHLQITIYYCTLYIIAFGMGGLVSSSAAFGAEQFDKFDRKELAQKISFFNWWTVAVSLGNLLAVTLLIYIENNVSWLLGYSMATIFCVISLLVFMLGTTLYRHKLPSGSSFTRIAQVIVAAIRKLSVPLIDQDSNNDVHEYGPGHHLKKKNNIKNNTSLIFMFLDKAALKTSSSSDSPWMLCPISQVEETKQIIRLLPVFIVTIMPSVMMAQVFTIFIKQGAALDQKLGPHFKVLPANLSAAYILSTLVSVVIYDKLLMPLMRKYTNNPRGITFLQRIGLGLVMHVIIMLGAALTERWRLSSSNNKHSTIFILLPQFVFMGIAEMFASVGKLEFFYDQAAEGMKSLGTSIYISTNGIGSFVNSFLLSLVSKVTGKDGEKGWIQNNLNSSHLDYYYALLAGLNAINLIMFLIVGQYYVYRCDVTNSKLKEKENEGSK